MCPVPVENVSSDLFDFLKNRVDVADSVDENGKFTDDPAKIKVFSFNFVNHAGEDKGSIVISLLDDSESSNSVKIYFGQEIADSDPETQKEWYAFLKEIRQFTKMHLLGFDVRNINKSHITRRDVEPMFESSFGPIDGTVKTSKQPLGKMQIIIKHSARVDPEVRNSRSRRIEKIYLANEKGEKFLLPFKSLLAARAMARHIESGGTPYDNVGGSICQLVEEMMVLNRFVRFVKHQNFAGDRETKALEASRERYKEIKKQLSRLTSNTGYAKFHDSVTVDAGEIEDDEIYEDMFNDIELDEENQLALPYVYRAYNKFKKSPEQDEFEKWAGAADGPEPGEQILNDEEEFEDDDAFDAEPTDQQLRDEDELEFDDPNPIFDPITDHLIGEELCRDCNTNPAYPGYRVCNQCYSEEFGHSIEDNDEYSNIRLCGNCGENEALEDSNFCNRCSDEFDSSLHERKGKELAEGMDWGFGGPNIHDNPELFDRRTEQFCHSCGGRLGVDCFNPEECAEITQQMERDQYEEQLKDIQCDEMNREENMREATDVKQLKLKWRVSAEPTGRYRSFEKRMWPSAEYATGEPAVQLICNVRYSGRSAKEEKLDIKVGLADYSNPSNKETGAGFTWRYLKQRASTLAEAKTLAETFLRNNPKFHPVAKPIEESWEGKQARKKAQIKKGKEAGHQDKAQINKEDMREDENFPYEYGGMNGTLSDKTLAGIGGMTESIEFENWVNEDQFGHPEDNLGTSKKICKICGKKSGSHTEDGEKRCLAALDKKEKSKKKVNEWFGKEKPINIQDEVNVMAKFLTKNAGFELIKAFDEDPTEISWLFRNSYFDIMFGPRHDENKPPCVRWVIKRNDKIDSIGKNAMTLIQKIMTFQEFRDVKMEPITEADAPSSAGFSSPLTTPHVYLGSKFRTNNEIAKHKNTTGKLSPFSLLDCPEKNTDDAGREVTTLTSVARSAINSAAQGSKDAINPPNL